MWCGDMVQIVVKVEGVVLYCVVWYVQQQWMIGLFQLCVVFDFGGDFGMVQCVGCVQEGLCQCVMVLIFKVLFFKLFVFGFVDIVVEDDVDIVLYMQFWFLCVLG